MNKTAIKNFAIWARNKLIADITYKAGLLGITVKEIKSPLPQSTQTVQFFDIGTKEPCSISGFEIEQRKKLVEEIQRKASQSDYPTAYKNVIEEVAYTWFNRLIAIRFMEVNDYLPARTRVLSSESNGKAEPDLVTHALEASLDYSAYEKDRIVQLKHENKLDELFRMLFIKQCNALNANLPELFEKTSNYTELLLNVSFTDKDGLVYHLVNDISEDDFNVSKEGQVEIIGWLYQYYNTEPKDETFALLKKNVKITKERIPAATQLFTPDWIVRYMVENSLGRLWLEGHPNDELRSSWKYYLDEVEQEEKVQKQLEIIREEYKTLKPEDIKVIDPAMGSGHILVYAFDVLMQIYESHGYSQRDAAISIVEKNLYGLDIDNRAYQLAYFAVMMKARQYNRRILNGETTCHVYAIQESNNINRIQLKCFGAGLSEMGKNTAHLQIQGLLDTFIDAKEYGSIIGVENYNWELLREFINVINADGQLSLDTIGVEDTKSQMYLLVEIGEVMARKYDVVVTNPPYMTISNAGLNVNDFVRRHFPDSKADMFAVFIERCHQMTGKYRYQAMITQHSWMFLSTYEKLRANISLCDTINLAHLGARAFEEIGGEVVQTTSFILCNRDIPTYMSTYCRLVEPTSQIGKEELFLSKNNRYYAPKDSFKSIPGMPISYWADENILNAFEKGKPLGKLVVARNGMKTGDNNRFLRLWWEVSSTYICLNAHTSSDAIASEKKWFPYNKGGGARKWYGNNDYVINWENGGMEIFEHAKADKRNVQDYPLDMKFAPSGTWSLINTGKPTFRYKEHNLSDIAGMSFYHGGDETKYYLGFCNSPVACEMLQLIAPTINYQAGDIGRLPILSSNRDEAEITELVSENILIAKIDWDTFESSWDFISHPLISHLRDNKDAECTHFVKPRMAVLGRISKHYEKWKQECDSRFIRVKTNEESINRIFIQIYGVQKKMTAVVDDSEVNIYRADRSSDIRTLISYAIGCIFGRYSLDVDGLVYAGAEWDNSKYKTIIPDKDNILLITDEEYFKDDIVGLFIEFVKKVYGQETLEENLDFIAHALSSRGNNSREIIRSYFIGDFFQDHCSAYSVTGSGKRPIYWLFDSGKQIGFKALVYMHRYDENTIGNLRIDYLHRMQRIYENEIGRMQDTMENSTDVREVTAATKRKEKLIKQLQETKEYDEKIAHLALERIPIDLDDGVKMNYEKVQTDRDGKKLDVLAKI